MHVAEWSKSEVEYGKKILDSGLDGARDGRDAFLNGRPLAAFINHSFSKALTPAAIGVCMGMVLSFSRKDRPSLRHTLMLGALGGFVGFAAGLTWNSRQLAARAVQKAFENVDKVRDEHWLEKNPIDYA